MLHGKGFWKKLSEKRSDVKIKVKASAMLVSARGESALSVCPVKIGESLEMLSMLDNRHASNGPATRISVLTTIYTKRFNSKEDDMEL